MWNSLSEALASYNSSELRQLLELLSESQTANTDHDSIQQITQYLLEHDLKNFYLQLDSTQRLAIAEAAHDPLGEYNEQRFYGKYRYLPTFYHNEVDEEFFHTRRYTELCLFLHYSFYTRSYYLPSDLQIKLKSFVTKPAPPQITSFEKLPDSQQLNCCDCEQQAGNELLQVLRMLEKEALQVNDDSGLATDTALEKIAEQLVKQDFYPHVDKPDWMQTIGHIRAFAWPLLLQAGELLCRQNSHLKLSRSGFQALSLSTPDVLKNLWQAWLQNDKFDEFCRIEAIKGGDKKEWIMTTPSVRRDAIAQTLKLCPINQWLAFEDFSRFMRATQHTFKVSNDPWELFIGNDEQGRLGENGFLLDWELLQERYIAVLLFEYAATLGIVDVAYRQPHGARIEYRHLYGAAELDFLSRYDGLCYFRITELGAYILDIHSGYQQPQEQGQIVIYLSPDNQLRICKSKFGKNEMQLLDNWAEQTQQSEWRLSRDRILISIENGRNLTELRRFLNKHARENLPDSLSSFLELCEKNAHAMQVSEYAHLIQCADSKTTEAVSSHPQTSHLCQRVSDTQLVVTSSNLEVFHEKAHELGLGLITSKQ